MTSNLHPDADFDHYDDWHECQDCGGLGDEDICCCAVPTPVRCDTCQGEGGWHLDHSAEEQALHEAENDHR